MKKSMLFIICLMVILIGVAYWGVKKGGWFQEKPGVTPQGEMITRELNVEKSPEKEKTPIKRGLSLKVYKITRGPFEDLLPTMGSIKGLVTRKLNFEAQGLVQEVNYRQGDLIKKDAVVARLRQVEAQLKIDYNKAKLKSAMVGQAQLEKKVRLHQELFNIGAINRLKLAEVEAEAANAKHQVEQTQVEIQSAEEELRKTEMRAPNDCILSERNIEVGEVVTPYNPKAMAVVELDNVYAEVGVVERDVTKIKIGQLTRVYVDAYPDMPFEGMVNNIYPALSDKTRTLPVEIILENKNHFLMPGMFARADIVLFEKPGVISIPRVAMKKVDETSLVYVIDEATNTAQERLVETGYVSTDYVEIVRGLKENELVAISNIEQLTSGTPVQITEIQVKEI